MTKKQSKPKPTQSQYIEKVKKERRQVIAENKKLLADLEAKEKEVNAVSAHRNFKSKLRLSRVSKTKGNSTAFLMWSDWHLEEIVNPAKVNYLNAFNLKVAKERVAACAYNSAKLVKEMSKSETIDRIVLCLMGDFFSGNIHDELLENTELRPIDASLFAREHLKASIETLLIETTQKIEIVCVVGNHSRVTKRIHVSNEQENSLEKFMYYFLKEDFKDNPRVTFHISDGYHFYLEVYGFNIRIHHGHSVRYNGGVGGLTIPMNKKIQIWNIANPAYLDLVGHYHTFFDGGNFIVNGSLIGYNPYALTIGAKYEPPKQVFFLLKEGYGKTIVAPIFLDKPKRK